MEQTANYGLNQWAAGDRIMREDFNADNAKVDQALGALAATVAGCGNCKVWTTSYIGTGTSDEAGASTLTFPQQPMVFFIAGSGGVGYNVRGNPTLFVRPGNSAYSCTGSWSGDGRTYTWYNSSVRYQLNVSGTVYTVVAFLSAE